MYVVKYIFKGKEYSHVFYNKAAYYDIMSDLIPLANQREIKFL